MKTLMEINDGYIKDILEFFCYEYYRMNIVKNEDRSKQILDSINNQIKNRISHLISDWRLEIDDKVFDKSDFRESLLSHVLDGEELKYPPMKFKFFYQQVRGLEIKMLDIIVQL